MWSCIQTVQSLSSITITKRIGSIIPYAIENLAYTKSQETYLAACLKSIQRTIFGTIERMKDVWLNSYRSLHNPCKAQQPMNNQIANSNRPSDQFRQLTNIKMSTMQMLI